MKTYHLFISYSRLDDTTYKKHTKVKSDVDVILERLRKEGIKFWIDREGKYCGEDFEEVIVDAIDNSEMLLFISSVNSNTNSKWVAREIKNASKKEKKIIPLLIDDTPFSKKFELTLEGLDNKLYYKTPKKALDDMVATIKADLATIKKNEDEAIAMAKAEEIRIKEEEDRKRKAEAENKRVEKLKEEMGRIQTQIIAAIAKQQLYVGKWIAKRRELKDESYDTKKCPICQADYEDNADHCEICGWFFGLPEELIPTELRQQYDDRMATALIAWERKKKADVELQTLMSDRNVLETQLETCKKALAEAKEKAKKMAEESGNMLKTKQNEIDSLRKELNESKSQLSAAQNSLAEQIKKGVEQEKQSSKQGAVAFLLVTEFGQPTVYLLYEGNNVFGAMSPQNQSPGYQMLVVADEHLMPRHFEICIEKINKQLTFKVRPLSDSCHLTYNSTANTIKAEQSISLGDILYIGNVKIQIIDNFNK